MRKRLAALLLTAALVVLTSCSRSGTPAQGTFFAVNRGRSAPVIDEYSAATGRALRQVASGQRAGMQVSGLSRFDAKTLLVTYSAGPGCSSGVAGCGPQPHTCGAELVSLRTDTKQFEVLWELGSDQRLSEAQLSPDGKKIVALTSPCVPSYFNDRLVVHRLADGKTWEVGDRVPRCHSLWAPRWADDSEHVFVTYAPATGGTPYTDPDGTCTLPGRSRIVRVDASRAQPTIVGPSVLAPVGCDFQSLATDPGSVYAVQACGQQKGPAKLIRFYQNLHPAQSWAAGSCVGGSSIAADATRGVAVSAYTYCPGQSSQQPRTVLDEVAGPWLLPVTSEPYGTLTIDDLTW